MNRWRLWFGIGLLVLWLSANAEGNAGAFKRQSVISGAPSHASLTVYRGDEQSQCDLRDVDITWPCGYALITETRVVDLPAGEFVLRFEGVAEGAFPETAIVSGLPHGVIEKNRDARLLSPSGLVDAYLRRAVQIRRTNIATRISAGAEIEMELEERTWK